MNDNAKFALLVLVVGAVFTVLAGCQPTGSGVDLTPIRDGLSFVGLDIVLAAIIGLVGRSRTKDREEPDEKHR